jgi:cytochrome oxidase assembly protein ShyY1
VLRFLLRPRWIALTLLALLAVPLCLAAGQWQWHRYEQRHAANQTQQRNLAAPPVEARLLTGPDRDVAAADRWRTVTATGRYDPANELLVRNRSQDGAPGFYVVTPLITADGSAILVNRGWVGLAATAAARPDVPAPPAGETTVTGRIRPSETRRGTGIRQTSAPAGQVYLIDTEEIGERLPYRLDRAVLELVSQRPQPRDAPAPVPAPDKATEWMNFAYALQWHLFAGLVPVGWLILAVQEVRRRPRRRTVPDGEPEPVPRPV